MMMMRRMPAPIHMPSSAQMLGNDTAYPRVPRYRYRHNRQTDKGLANVAVMFCTVCRSSTLKHTTRHPTPPHPTTPRYSQPSTHPFIQTRQPPHPTHPTPTHPTHSINETSPAARSSRRSECRRN
ncbi:uncharacterized protein K452DRAFT_40641 [Aplosporella prunicola CBS 121167]|uniref:Uncharacterized protein n=1 Tax=Aplosporella prunicola CBS 121167 TaxID=1176127 RepID=A0A6A6BE38_9PEZI|nr:uncharacterized protein K452DRAFT_40641 [Aplosporella prunicola CBS 121167]KAF2141524.1 hypothetical protein K452DRAFT_40641 [Aplosporella prunicola CBS 121167]